MSVPDKNTSVFTIRSYMTDCRYCLRDSSFMELAQVMAMEGSRSLGFGYDRLDPEHKAWILYRMQFKFIRPVMWNDVVTMKTWHKGQDGVVFLRDYELFGEDGELSVAGTSSWVIMDTEARSFVRNADLPDFISVHPQCPDAAYGFPPQKVVHPRGAEPETVRTHEVCYSDVDFIGHTNNVKYVEWAMDSIDQRFASEHQVKEVTVNFTSETRLGDEVDIYRYEECSGSSRVFYVEGFSGGRQSFAVRLEF